MRWIKLAAAGLGLFAATVWILNAYIKVSSQKFIYKNVYFAPKTDAAIVPGASVYRSGKLSPILKSRVETGIEYMSLWDSVKIVFSGHSIPKGYSEPRAMAQFAKGQDVPEDRVVLDNEGRSTYATIFNCRFKYGYSKIAIISQEYHLPRALYLARKLGLNAIGVVTPEPSQRGAKTPLREVSSRIKDFCLVHFLRMFRSTG